MGLPFSNFDPIKEMLMWRMYKANECQMNDKVYVYNLIPLGQIQLNINEYSSRSQDKINKLKDS